jgi:acyl carrier protein
MSCNTHETTYFRAVNRVLKPAQPVTFDDHWYDLGTDPLIVLQLVGQLEDVFGVRVDKSELARIRTVRQLYDLFMQHMAEGITLRNLPRELAELGSCASFEHRALNLGQRAVA